MKLEIIQRFFALLEQFQLDEAAFEPLLHPEVEQTEYPNRLTERVTVSDKAALFARMPGGKKLLQAQRYDIRNVIESGDTVVTEVVWTAVIGADVGPFKQGQQLTAYFCCVFEFKDGKIFRQRNYDCFEPF